MIVSYQFWAFEMQLSYLSKTFPLILVFAVLPALGEGVLTIGTPAVDGSNVTVPVFLDGNLGDGVAALDFTLRYDPAILAPNGVRAGEAALAAEKGVQYNLTSPGNYVVMMFGLNQSTMDAGKVAEVSFRRVDTSSAAETNLTIDGTTLASLAGQTIASQGSSSTFELNGSPANDPDPEDPDTPPGEDPDGGSDVPDDEGPVPAPDDDADDPADGSGNPVPSGGAGSPVVPTGNGDSPSQGPELGERGGMPQVTRSGAPAELSDSASRLSQLNRMAKEFERKRAALPSPPAAGAIGTESATPASSPDDAVKTSVVDQHSPLGRLRPEGREDAQQMASLAPTQPNAMEEGRLVADSSENPVAAPAKGTLWSDPRTWVAGVIALVFGAGLVLRKRLLS